MITPHRHLDILAETLKINELEEVNFGEGENTELFLRNVIQKQQLLSSKAQNSKLKNRSQIHPRCCINNIFPPLSGTVQYSHVLDATHKQNLPPCR